MNWFAKKTVVVPIDFSEQSFAAAEVALDAVPESGGLHVLHVLPVLVPTDPVVGWGGPDDDTRREAVESTLRQRLSALKYRDAKIVVLFGDPGQEVAAYAAQVGAELIVLPSHGRTGLKHLLIGSVAERVCRLAHCPVLVLRS
ncbi:MAG: universal stress protein [Planctomycetes bacterium]|nr:universal stress protein [Planctomycetota bacterium]